LHRAAFLRPPTARQLNIESRVASGKMKNESNDQCDSSRSDAGRIKFTA